MQNHFIWPVGMEVYLDQSISSRIIWWHCMGTSIASTVGDCLIQMTQTPRASKEKGTGSEDVNTLEQTLLNQ